MERHKLTADQAFQLLVEVSSRPTPSSAPSPTTWCTPATSPPRGRAGAEHCPVDIAAIAAALA